MDGLVWSLIREAAGALAPGLVMLLGLGGAAFVFRKSKGAGVVLVLAMLVLGLELFLAVLAPAGLAMAGMQGTLVSTLWYALSALMRGFGVLLCVVAACVGPAPARDEEDY